MLAPNSIDIKKVDGQFREKEFGCYFEYSNSILSKWDKRYGATHRIFTADGTRAAIVKKTVAYVFTDENSDGSPIIEKWYISHIWDRN